MEKLKQKELNTPVTSEEVYDLIRSFTTCLESDNCAQCVFKEYGTKCGVVRDTETVKILKKLLYTNRKISFKE